jgi:hypothetical protein
VVILVTAEELEAGARRVYETARRAIDCVAWEDVPDWRRLRWEEAYKAAVAVREGSPRARGRTVRLARVEAVG